MLAVAVAAFDMSLWTGLELWGGCLLLVCPILLVPSVERTVLHNVFAACRLTVIAAAIGTCSTPIVGYEAAPRAGSEAARHMVNGSRLSFPQ